MSQGSQSLITPIPVGKPTFLDVPRLSDLSELEAGTDVAIIGVPYGYAYDMSNATFPSAAAPAAMREQSMRWPRFLSHYDYDFGGEIFAGRDVKIVDCGDIFSLPGDFAGNSARTTAAIRAILDVGAVPIVLGGDHSIPIPVTRAYEGSGVGDICVVQIDQHIDWRQERNGVTEGLSSPMRRASELDCVKSMAQIGVHGVGSARQEEVDAANAWGSVIITAREVHAQGMDAVLAKIPQADNYYITIDADGLDAALAPGVLSPGLGGLTYYQAFDLLRGLAQRGRIAGCDLVEVVPTLDVGNITSLASARLLFNLIGAMAHSGQIGKK